MAASLRLFGNVLLRREPTFSIGGQLAPGLGDLLYLLTLFLRRRLTRQRFTLVSMAAVIFNVLHSTGL
jgi:hypothetical protein